MKGIHKNHNQNYFIEINPFIISNVLPSGCSERYSLLSVHTLKYPYSSMPTTTALSTPVCPESLMASPL